MYSFSVVNMLSVCVCVAGQNTPTKSVGGLKSCVVGKQKLKLNMFKRTPQAALANITNVLVNVYYAKLIPKNHRQTDSPAFCSLVFSFFYVTCLNFVLRFFLISLSTYLQGTRMPRS